MPGTAQIYPVKTKDKAPNALGRWYQQTLAIRLTPSSYDAAVLGTGSGTPMVFSPFPESSGYFGDFSVPARASYSSRHYRGDSGLPFTRLRSSVVSKPFCDAS